MDVNPEFTSHVDGRTGRTAYHYGHLDPQLGVNLRWGSSKTSV